MKYTLLVLAICLGIAAARPGKRQAEPRPPKAPNSTYIPTPIEYEALEKVGGAMKTLASIAWDHPQGVIDFVNGIEDAMNNIDEGTVKRALHERAQGKPKASEGKSSEIDEMTKAVMEYGVYKALIGKVFVDGVILEHTKLGVEHAIAMEACKDDPSTCPESPDFAGIVAAEIEEAVNESESSEETTEEEDDSLQTRKRQLIAKLLELLN